MENKTKNKEKYGYEVLPTVPYQVCPLCNGTGQTIADGFTSAVYKVCKVCNGAMIIPMHILPTDYKLGSWLALFLTVCTSESVQGIRSILRQCWVMRFSNAGKYQKRCTFILKQNQVFIPSDFTTRPVNGTPIATTTTVKKRQKGLRIWMVIQHNWGMNAVQGLRRMGGHAGLSSLFNFTIWNA